MWTRKEKYDGVVVKYGASHHGWSIPQAFIFFIPACHFALDILNAASFYQKKRT
jgi:hypothetical protein